MAARRIRSYVAVAALIVAPALSGCGGSTRTVTTTVVANQSSPQSSSTASGDADTQSTETGTSLPTPTVTDTTDTGTTATDTTITNAPAVSSQLIGTWLGPEPGFNQSYCSYGTALFRFSGDGTWVVNLVNQSDCGGTYSLAGTYSVQGSNLTLHYSYCPELCPGDTSENVTFVDVNDFTMTDASFTGTYHRQ